MVLPTQERHLRDQEYETKLIQIRWAAYKTIEAGGTYSIGDEKIYTSVRKRLKRMFQGNEEKLSRFKLIEETEYKTKAHQLMEFLYLLGEKLRK